MASIESMPNAGMTAVDANVNAAQAAAPSNEPAAIVRSVDFFQKRDGVMLSGAPMDMGTVVFDVAAAPEAEAPTCKNYGVPKDLRPETGVPNRLPKDVKKGEWFHPKTELTFMGNKPWNWSYQYTFMVDGGPDLEIRQHDGGEGKFFVRQAKGPSQFVLGVMTTESFTDKDGKVHDVSHDVNPNGEPQALGIKGHPGVEYHVFDAATCQEISLVDQNGEPMQGLSSESGDIEFILGSKGAVIITAEIPEDIALETEVRKDKFDNATIRAVDLRGSMK